ncbi:MAG: hypothetical protein E6L05_04160 [Thaumarchaeota archaeon]|nr:MAG: hypothetical protein E6L05_04160 [Nitrososphaerota archaeon]
MDLRKLLSILIISAVLFSMSQVFAQQVTIGKPPVEDVIVRIDEGGTAHVTHYVKGNSVDPVQAELIKNNVTALSVTDTNGNSVQYSVISNLQKQAVLIFPAQRNITLIKYNLPQIVSLNNGVWKWNYYTPTDTTFTDFFFPKGVDMIWANDRPVYLGEQGLRQHGDGMILQYIINEPVVSQNVKWQDKDFTVGIRTLADLGPYAFDQSAKAYAFDINKSNSLVTVIMPQELLWGPYQGKLNGNGTLTTTFHKNGTHAWIGLKPAKTGTIQLTGTTAIPEFPLFVPLVIGIAAVIALQFRNHLKFN